MGKGPLDKGSQADLDAAAPPAKAATGMPRETAASSLLALQRGAGNRAVSRLARDAQRQPGGPNRLLQRDVATALMGAGAAVLGLDAEASPVEAATGPPGWAVAGTLGIIGAGLLGIGYAMSSGGRPSRNTDQNKQFSDAVREIERRIGRRLSKDEIRRLHEALHGEENPGYHEIVDLGVGMFGDATGSTDDSSGGTGAGVGDDGGDDSSGSGASS